MSSTNKPPISPQITELKPHKLMGDAVMSSVITAASFMCFWLLSILFCKLFVIVLNKAIPANAKIKVLGNNAKNAIIYAANTPNKI